jgi:hypothetical protein
MYKTWLFEHIHFTSNIFSSPEICIVQHEENNILSRGINIWTGRLEENKQTWFSTPEIHHRSYQPLPLDKILSQFNPVYILTPVYLRLIL